MTVHGMIPMDWNRLGPREKELLAILRRSEQSLTSREVQRELREDGVDVVYSTVSATLDRLVEKRLVDRTEEMQRGSPRYRHTFAADQYAGELLDSIVEDVSEVLGTDGLTGLVRRAEAMGGDEQSNEHNSTNTKA
ncbi:BlaI/MecI/CopY family transcriptional regulator [Halogeometricum borinquense]|nr:BlaI/MecI/CopY family transcriptional regulator [Halogeometricum borinquense]